MFCHIGLCLIKIFSYSQLWKIVCKLVILGIFKHLKHRKSTIFWKFLIEIQNRKTEENQDLKSNWIKLCRFLPKSNPNQKKKFKPNCQSRGVARLQTASILLHCKHFYYVMNIIFYVLQYLSRFFDHTKICFRNQH